MVGWRVWGSTTHADHHVAVGARAANARRPYGNVCHEGAVGGGGASAYSIREVIAKGEMSADHLSQPHAPLRLFRAALHRGGANPRSRNMGTSESVRCERRSRWYRGDQENACLRGRGLAVDRLRQELC